MLNQDVGTKSVIFSHMGQVVAAFENSSDAVSFIDINYIYRHVNSVYSKYYFKPISEIIGKSPACFVGEHYFESFIKPNLDRCLSGEVVSYCEWFHFPTFGQRYMSVQYTPQYDQDGIPIGVLHVSRDLTDQKKIEENKVKDHMILRAIVDGLPGALSVVDCEFNLIATNKMRHIGAKHDVEILKYKKCYEVFQKIKVPCPWCKLEEVVRTGNPITEITKNNDPREKITGKGWKVFLEPIKNEHGNVVGVIEYGVDITELRKAKEDAIAANKSKSAFLANMSHEIRTPINGVMGMIQLLQQTKLSEEQLEFTHYALQSTKRLTQLLADILDLAKVESGKLQFESRETDIRHLLDEVGRLFFSTAREKGLQLLFDVDDHVQGLILTDPLRLHQVFNNVIGNAIKFTDFGTIIVKCKLLRKGDSDMQILFSVTDEGVGISDDSLLRIFKPFEQGRSDYQKKFQGAGLGLAITRQIVELMGGDIYIESEEQVGTTVYVSLSFEVVNSTREKIHQDKQGITFSQFNCLVVEDDKVSQIVAKKALERLGHHVVTVNNGYDAIQAISEQKFDVVFMDIQMPDMDGVEVAQKIRRGDAGENNMSINMVAMTAYAMRDDKDKFLDGGFDAYISKPIELTDIDSILYKLTS